MRFLSLLTLFTLCLISSASFAEDGVAKGKFAKDAKLKPYTNQQLDEAVKISDSCKAYDYTSIRYDCDCVGLKFLELRRKRGDGASQFELTQTAQQKCPNTPSVAGKIYTECTGWAPRQRGEDYQEFCSCYGSTYAKLFAKNPSEDLNVVESQMTRAMSSCNVNAVNVRAQERDEFIEKLKEKKVYDILFPGANENP
jgi:hypothetical protein